MGTAGPSQHQGSEVKRAEDQPQVAISSNSQPTGELASLLNHTHPPLGGTHVPPLYSTFFSSSSSSSFT